MKSFREEWTMLEEKMIIDKNIQTTKGHLYIAYLSLYGCGLWHDCMTLFAVQNQTELSILKRTLI